MASRRRLKRNACVGKARHKTFVFAQIALRKLYQASGEPRGTLCAYKCPFCKGFHVGHKPKQEG